MACFIVPGAEAIVATAAFVVAKKVEAKKALPSLSSGESKIASDNKIAFSKKLSWLLALLWGGVILLAFEHFWHGEITPFAPFLTAMANPEDAAEMVAEMSTVGVSMAAAVTAVWGILCGVASAIVKRKSPAEAKAEA